MGRYFYLFVFTLIILLSACTFGPEHPYSKTWPPLKDAKVGCFNFSGTYRYPGERPEEYYTKTCGQELIRELFGDSYRPSYFLVRQSTCDELIVELPEHRLATSCSSDSVACSFDGTVVSAATDARTGVDSRNWGKVELMLDRSGSIVGKHTINSVLRFVFIPFYYNSFYRWCRFERIAP